jgi:hypothetical protein
VNAIIVDTSQLAALAADLGGVPATVVKPMNAVTKRAAQNIKNDLVADAQSSGHLKHFSRSISYDRVAGIGSIGYEIGPDKDRTQGALGNIAYFGTSKNGPVLSIDGPLEAETPRFEQAVLGVLGQALR